MAKWPERQAQLSLPALTTGTELGFLATTSSANGFEQSVNGLVNMVLVISGVGTTYQGTTCERFKTLGWTSTGQEVWLTVWEPPADITELLCDGARVLGESLKIGCHDGEISLSGRAEITELLCDGAPRRHNGPPTYSRGATSPAAAICAFACSNRTSRASLSGKS